MEEKTYLLERNEDRERKTWNIIAGIVLCFGSVILIICWILMFTGIEYDYLYIIRTSTDNFDGIKRNVCLVNYFKNFPYGNPNIGYEYIGNVSMETSPIYTLELMNYVNNIPIHWKNDYDITEIKQDFDNNFDNGKKILIAWNYDGIPKLMKLLGCKKCNITDNSQFDIVWILGIGRHIWRQVYEDVKLITVSLDLNESVVTIKMPITENMSMRDKLRNFECISNSKYIVKEW